MLIEQTSIFYYVLFNQKQTNRLSMKEALPDVASASIQRLVATFLSKGVTVLCHAAGIDLLAKFADSCFHVAVVHLNNFNITANI